MPTSSQDFNQTLVNRLSQATAKACKDNNTNDPTYEQIFKAVLDLKQLAPNDERWHHLLAPLLFML